MPRVVGSRRSLNTRVRDPVHRLRFDDRTALFLPIGIAHVPEAYRVADFMRGEGLHVGAGKSAFASLDKPVITRDTAFSAD